MSTGNLKICTIDGSKYCAKNKCNTIITLPRRHKHPSSSANRPSDVAVTVNINAEFNLMAVNPIIECFSRDLVPEYYQGSESSAVYTAPPLFVESLPGRSNMSLPCLPFAYACKGNHSYISNVNHQYRTIPSPSPHPDMSPVVRNDQSLANRHNQQ